MSCSDGMEQEDDYDQEYEDYLDYLDWLSQCWD